MATQNVIPAKNGFLKFHQFAKLEEGKKGEQPTVWGVATWEQPDSDNEVADYETAKPVYQAWSDKALQRTTKAGQEPSLGCIRVQHGSTVGGKATKLEFDDKAKEVWLGSEPIDEEMHRQLKQGYFTGYSQGGSYAWRACDVCETPLSLQQGNNYCPQCDGYVIVRYGLKRLAEVSYVDSPATGEGFEHVKANGSREILKFAKKENTLAKTKTVAGVALPSHCFAFVGDPEKTETWKLPIEFPGDEKKTERHIRNALARFEQTQGIPEGEKAKVKAKIEAAARSHGIEVDGQKSVKVRELIKSEIAKAATAKGISEDVTKGLYMVSRAADMLESMACLWEHAVWEREIEGDDSEVPDELKNLLDSFIETFLAMATEEARELSAKKTDTGEKPMTPEELEALNKAAKKSLATHFAKIAAHHEKMADDEEKCADIHEKADVGCKDCMGKADTAKAARVEALKAENAVAKAAAEAAGETFVAKEDVSSGADHGDIHEVLANQQEFHKAMASVHMKKAAKHDKMADHYTKMAESHDEEAAKATKAEIVAFDAANPEPAPVVKEAPKDDTLEESIKKAAQAHRDSPEYKASVAAIAKAQVDAEVAKLRDTTLAPLGVELDATTGAAIIKGLKVVPRDEKPGDFAFAGKGDTGTHAGL